MQEILWTEETPSRTALGSLHQSHRPIGGELSVQFKAVNYMVSLSMLCYAMLRCALDLYDALYVLIGFEFILQLYIQF